MNAYKQEPLRRFNTPNADAHRAIEPSAPAPAKPPADSRGEGADTLDKLHAQIPELSSSCGLHLDKLAEDLAEAYRRRAEAGPAEAENEVADSKTAETAYPKRLIEKALPTPGPPETDTALREGSAYVGEVKNVVPYGAFVEIAPGKTGLLHISEIAHEFIEEITDYFEVGDKIEVKLTGIQGEGKYRLTRKPFVAKPGSYGTRARPVDAPPVSARTESVRERLMVDGLNVCFWTAGAKRRATLDVLLALLLALDLQDRDFVCFFDASAPHKLEGKDVTIYRRLIGTLPRLDQVPSRTDADSYVLQQAHHEELRVISDDHYDEYKGEYPWIEREPKRLIKGLVSLGNLRIPPLRIYAPVRTDTQGMAEELVRRLGG